MKYIYSVKMQYRISISVVFYLKEKNVILFVLYRNYNNLIFLLKIKIINILL